MSTLTFHCLSIYSHGCACLVTQVCLTLCDPMDYSTPASCLPEFAQTHVHCVGDVTQSLPSLSPPALNLSQHQDLFQ